MMGIKELRDKHLSLARELIEHGVPVFVAKPVPKTWNGRSEFFFPPGWPYLDADEKHLAAWEPGWAVCAVTGFMFDVLDIDPRHGGDVSVEILKAAEVMPAVHGQVATPSGGLHLYLNRSGLRKFTPWNGVDLQAGDNGGNGRGFVYIPPTRRKGKVYRLETPINWDELAIRDHPGYMPFYETLVKFYKFKPQELRALAPQKDLDLTPSQQQEVLDRAISIANIVRLAQVGYRDTTLNKYSYTMGGLISGSGLSEDWAVALLEAATEQWGITPDEHANWVMPKIARGIQQGKEYPLEVFTPEFDEDSAWLEKK